MNTEAKHKTVIASLSSDTRKALLERSDAAGIKQFAMHFGFIILFSLYILFKLPIWQVLLPVQGILLVFLFTALHETIHGTAFKTPWMNTVISQLCGVIIFVPANWFKYFHFEHHRHTNQPDLDPELAESKPQTFSQYALYLSGIPVGMSLCKTLIINALGKNTDNFISQKNIIKIIIESVIYLSFYSLLIFISFYFNSTILLWLWLFPIMLSQPFLRAYLLAEHALCPQVNNMLLNSRTTLTSRIVYFIAWNMPYHAEHHSLPSVPFFKLPLFHQEIRDHLETIDQGYFAFHRKMLKKVGGVF